MQHAALIARVQMNQFLFVVWVALKQYIVVDQTLDCPQESDATALSWLYTVTHDLETQTKRKPRICKKRYDKQ